MAPAAAAIDNPWAMGAGSVRSIVLLLHGGEETSTKTAGRWRGPYLRMIPFAAALHRQGHRRGLSVLLLRYRYRGWNDPELPPLADARWALDHLGEHYPDAPVALLGHSMGGRTALRVADHPAVVAVCALAPWTPEGEPVRQLTERSVLIAHGDRDRVTDPRLSYRFAVRARAASDRVCRFDVLGDGHAMLRRHRDWSALVTRFIEPALGLSDPDPLITDAMARPVPEGLNAPLPGRLSWPT
ncbi:MAG: alpha/beta hydrolase [Pseudonocardiales bacterium]|nr:alpha/beta fold hydrolase [Actinomycetota bacterium]PZS12999.1 MAG: alpha/beta hydrolase [Pseudonocardiales bacterium]